MEMISKSEVMVEDQYAATVIWYRTYVYPNPVAHATWHLALTRPTVWMPGLRRILLTTLLPFEIERELELLTPIFMLA
jgi:hypothetical protein